MILNSAIVEKNWPLTDVLIQTLPNQGQAGVVGLVVSNEGKFVYKIAGAWKEKQALTQDLLGVELLLKKGFHSVPKILRTRGNNFLIEIKGSYVYLLEYIDGSIPDKSAETYKKLGLLTAELHSVEGYPYKTEFTPAAIIESNLYKIAYELPFKTEYLKVVDTLPEFKDLPEVVIHTDIAPSNAVLKENGELVLLDWDDVGLGARVLDVSFPLIQQFVTEDCELQEDIAKAFYDSYKSRIKLTQREKQNIFTAVFLILNW